MIFWIFWICMQSSCKTVCRSSRYNPVHLKVKTSSLFLVVGKSGWVWVDIGWLKRVISYTFLNFQVFFIPLWKLCMKVNKKQNTCFIIYPVLGAPKGMSVWVYYGSTRTIKFQIVFLSGGGSWIKSVLLHCKGGKGKDFWMEFGFYCCSQRVWECFFSLRICCRVVMWWLMLVCFTNEHFCVGGRGGVGWGGVDVRARGGGGVAWFAMF